MAIGNLQKAQIIRVGQDFIDVAHPDLAKNFRSYLTADIAAAGTTATVDDGDGWADNDFYIQGYPGDTQTEENDINDATPTGTSLTVTNGLAYAHKVDSPMIRIQERQIRIKGAATLAGSQTEVTGSPFNIRWNQKFTRCIPTTTDYAFYFAEFYDASAVYGPQSDGVAEATGLGETTAEEMIQNALNLIGEKIDESQDGQLTRPNLLKELNNWQDDITSRRDWSWETVDEETLTTTTLASKYALSGLTSTLKHLNSEQSVIAVRFADTVIDWFDYHDYQGSQEGIVNTTLKTAITALTPTSAVLTDSYEFAESGQFLIGSDTPTYTANTETTGTLSGIAATDFASSHAVGAQIWQGTSAGKPNNFVIYNDNIYLDRPVSSAEAGKKLKFSFYKKIARLADLTDVTLVVPHYLAQYFIAARVEYMKGNLDKGNQWMALYESKLANEMRKDRVPTIKRITPVGDDTQPLGKRYFSTESSRFN